MNVTVLKCPNCGASLGQDARQCEFCSSPVIISSFDGVTGFTPPLLNKYISSYRAQLAENNQSAPIQKSLAMCFLKLKLYPKALEHFEKAIGEDFADSDNYFYAAVCKLGGQVPFVLRRDKINEIEGYIQAAILVAPSALLYYFWAYIRYDYFERKSFLIDPGYAQLLDAARQLGLTPGDARLLFSVLEKEIPEALYI